MAVTTTTGRSTISETLDAIERLRAMRVKASGGDVLEPPGVSDERARKLACILWMAENFQAWQLDQLLLQADLLVGAVNAFGERAIPRWKMTDPTNEAQQNNEAAIRQIARVIQGLGLYDDDGIHYHGVSEDSAF